VFVGLVIGEGLLYRKIVSANPFQDTIVSAIMTAQGVIAAVIVFFYVIKNSR
jgi:hypothetical protein